MARKANQLDAFFRHHEDAQRVIGTYFYPIRFFGTPAPNDRYAATEVIASATTNAKEILITRMSGLFVRPPAELSNPYQGSAEALPADDLQAKLSFEEDAAQAFNKVICEFCLLGLVSQPTSPVHISYAQLIDQHILITGGGGGREYYGDRSSVPALDLLQARWLAWRTQPESIVNEAIPLRRAEALARISETLPEFVAGAYSLYSQRQTSEALSDSWVVCEQLLNYLWDDFCDSLGDSPRQRRLKGARSANLRLEVLETAQFIPDSLAEALHLARGRRNNLMHHARTDIEAAREGVEAMKATLEHVLGEEVAEPSVSTGVTW